LNIETRTLDSKQANVRVEKRDDGKRYIKGYAAVFYREGVAGTEYRLFNDLYERILPGAFKDAVKDDDVRALLNHDPNLLLARSGNGLVLREDETGLYYEFPVDENDPDHLRVVAKLDRGDLKGSSFGFEPIERRFVDHKDFDVVELAKVRLYDVSPATFPAYEGTSVGIRSTDGIENLKKERDAWKRSQQETSEDSVSMRIRQAKAEAGIL
jgi:uncharacterized protein